MKTVISILAASLATQSTYAFLTPQSQIAIQAPKLATATTSSTSKSTSTTNLYSSTSSFPEIIVVKVDPETYDTDDDQIMQVASFRNQRTSPEQMIAAQQAKRDSFDPVQSAIQGAKIGAGIGAAAGLITFVSGFGDDAVTITNQIMNGLTYFAVIGGTTASLLAYNNYSGNRVYVMDIKEARNRLTVDFVASLKISQDVGFVAYLEPDYALTFKNGRFEGCNGIVATVDCQLRNSKLSKELEGGVAPRTGPPELGAHVHLKNMDVDETIRRKGIAKKLMDKVEEWAISDTDAQLMSLEVRDDNVAAVSLYEGSGFVKDTVTKRNTKKGLSFMVKKF